MPYRVITVIVKCIHIHTHTPKHTRMSAHMIVDTTPAQRIGNPTAASARYICVQCKVAEQE